MKLGTRGNSEGWSWGHGGGVSEGWGEVETRGR